MSSDQAGPPAHRFAEGLARYQAGDKEGALAFFQRAAQERPEDAEAHYLLGLTLFKQGRHAEAIGPLRHSAGLHPGEDALVKLAMAQGQTGDMAGCLATLKDAARRLPGSAPVRAYLGTTLRTLDRLEEALDAYQAALARDPDHVLALWGLGLALGMAGRPGEGKAVLRRATLLDPAFPPPHFHLGVLAWITGEPEETRRQHALLGTLAPSYAERLGAIMNERKGHAVP
jgi:tetratricopeptide (TPR) repeat protein